MLRFGENPKWPYDVILSIGLYSILLILFMNSNNFSSVWWARTKNSVYKNFIIVSKREFVRVYSVLQVCLQVFTENMSTAITEVDKNCSAQYLQTPVLWRRVERRYKSRIITSTALFWSKHIYVSFNSFSW